MKIARMLAAAGLVVASLGVAGVAHAKDHGRGQEHRDNRGRDAHRGGYDRGDRRHDNGNHYGWRNGRGHHRCHTEWRHHHQVRICR